MELRIVLLAEEGRNRGWKNSNLPDSEGLSLNLENKVTANPEKNLDAVICGLESKLTQQQWQTHLDLLLLATLEDITRNLIIRVLLVR